MGYYIKPYGYWGFSDCRTVKRSGQPRGDNKEDNGDCSSHQLGRDGEGDVLSLTKFAGEPFLMLSEWCERGIRLVVVTQQIDLSGTAGRLVASVLFGLAEIGQEYRRDRQAAGIAVAKRKGVYRGREKGTTKAKPTRAWALRARGLSAPEIANALKVSPRTIFCYLATRGR